MFDSDFWEDFFIFIGMVGCGFVLALAAATLILPKPDYTKDRQLCESGGGVWSEVVHNQEYSFCTYNNNGR